jgi:hypothetical protein
MMSHGNGHLEQFKVIISGRLKRVIEELHGQAAQLGLGREFLATLRKIHHNLETNPRTFGDPLFRLPSMKLLVYHAMVSRVAVDYGVHDENKLVIVRNIRFLGSIGAA